MLTTIVVFLWVPAQRVLFIASVFRGPEPGLLPFSCDTSVGLSLLVFSACVPPLLGTAIEQSA
jgi:hypothetical protein